MKLFENIKVLENLKKGLLQGIGFFLVVGLVGVTYATYTAANSGDVLTTSMWNNRNAPDYDSGWVADGTTTNHTSTFTHNFGTIPSRVVLLVSPDNTGTRAKYTPLNSPGLSYSSPESTIATATSIKLRFFASDNFIYCDVNNICEGGNTTNTGYIKVLAWK